MPGAVTATDEALNLGILVQIQAGQPPQTPTFERNGPAPMTPVEGDIAKRYYRRGLLDAMAAAAVVLRDHDEGRAADIIDQAVAEILVDEVAA